MDWDKQRTLKEKTIRDLMPQNLVKIGDDSLIADMQDTDTIEKISDDLKADYAERLGNSTKPDNHKAQQILMKQENIVLMLGDDKIEPLKILFETNELNYACADDNCEWTTLDNPHLKWIIKS